jgi:hypothetical protein
VQGVEHRLAGDPDQPAKGLIQLQDQENSAETAGAETIKARMTVALRRQRAETEENGSEPETRMISIGSEMETDCATNSDRSGRNPQRASWLGL